MAERTYNGSPVLSKIKLPGVQNPYYLKDADARAILNAINDDVYESLKLALGTVDAGGNNLVTASNIKDYVDRIAEIGFDVVVLQTLPHPTAPTEEDYNTYKNNIVLIPDATSTTGAYVEYVILRQGTEGAYTYNWEKIGTTQVDLSGYLKNVSYVDNTHTLQQTKNENGVEVTTNVHQFGNLADANTASGTYTLPTGSGTVTINQYDIDGGNAQAITGEGTTDIPYVDALGGTTTFNVDAVKDVELTGTQTFVVNAVKDLNLTGTGRTFTTNGIKNVSIVDNAETGTKVVNGITGTTVFNTDAVKNVQLGGTQSFNVDGISNAQLTSTASTNTVVTGLTGTTSYATYAIKANVDDDECLVFSDVDNSTFGVATTTLGITTTAATFATVTVSSEPAATGTFNVTEKNINLSTVNADTDSFGITYTMTQGTTANYGTVGVTSTPAATATVTVTPKHIHITHTTPTATVTVNTTTATVTVNPDPRNQEI